MSSSQRPPTIDPTAASRWARQPAQQSPWLHEEVARRMETRLQWIAKQPAHWVHWQPLQGGLQAQALLTTRYPQATSYVVQGHPHQSQVVKAALQPPWWKRGLRKAGGPVFERPDSPVHMVWANMALHMEADPIDVIRQWHALLEVDGFLMFSCLGPDTVRELHALYATLGWPTPGHSFTDMHDWGDMLVHNGFSAPIVDMERITLTFSSPESLLQELRGLGRNLHPQRFGALRGRGWLAQLKAQMPSQLASPADPSRLQLTFEIIYGHAFKPPARIPVTGESSISLEQMRQSLKASAAAPRKAPDAAG